MSDEALALALLGLLVLGAWQALKLALRFAWLWVPLGAAGGLLTVLDADVLALLAVPVVGLGVAGGALYLVSAPRVLAMVVIATLSALLAMRV